MKLKSLLLNSAVICAFSLLGYGLGRSIGNSSIGEYNPPWTHYLIHSLSKEIVNIVHVDIQSDLEDPTGDVLYVATKNGNVYSNTLFQSDWLLVNPVPTWDNSYITKCAQKSSTPTDSHMWDSPPVGKMVIDSAGVRFERPISTITRCYVLISDGSLEVWIHSGDAVGLIMSEFWKTVYALFGTVLGIIIGVIIIRLKKRSEISST